MLRVLVTVTAIVAVAGASAGTDVSRQTVSTRDPVGDTKSRDLDLVKASLTRSAGKLMARFTTRATIGKNVIFSVFISTGKTGYQLGAKRAAGATTFFVFRSYPDSRQFKASGIFDGRTATIGASAAPYGLERSGFRFYFTAEGTNGRPQHADRAPNDDRSTEEQFKTPLERTLKFPAAP